MSGIELAGLVLGAIPVAQASYVTIGNFFRAWRSANSQITRVQKLYKIEANMFRVSIRVLFTDLLDKRIVVEMLDHSEHRLWKSKKIQEQLGTIFSEDLDVSEAIKVNIELVKKTLTEIEDVFHSIEERAKEATSSSSKSDRPNRIAKVFLGHLQQTSWAFSKKAKIESLLNEINVNNSTLYKFANEIRKNRKKPPYKASPLVPFDRVSGFHSRHTHLYNALTSACGSCDCSGHRVDLALDYMPTVRRNSLLVDPSSDFKVVFHVHPSPDCSTSWQIDLTHFETNTANPLKRKTLDAETTGEGITRSRGATISKRFTQKDSELKSDQDAATESDDVPITPAPKNESLEAQAIDNLCSALQQLDWSEGDLEAGQRNLGYLLHQKMHAYEVRVSSIPRGPKANTDSLDHILSDATCDAYIKTHVMYPFQRLRLAYVLSLSLLRLYPSPWLDVKDRWASNDVRFLLTELSPGKCVVTPHIMGPSQAEKEIRSGAVRGLVKNYQIYALGVMLLEIAIGKPIDTSVIPGDLDYETKEFLAALKFDKDGIVAQALGSRYANIVSRCLLFRFDGVESDLRREELQRAFYEDVVCQLEDCVRELSSQGANIL